MDWIETLCAAVISAGAGLTYALFGADGLAGFAISAFVCLVVFNIKSDTAG